MKKQHIADCCRKSRNSIALFLLVLFLCWGAQMAANAQMSAERRFSGEAVVCLTPEALTRARAETPGAAANAAEGITAAYAYRLVPSKAEHDQAEVEAEIALSFGAGDGLTIQASGEVWAYSVSDGETLWEGPLDGETWYQGRRYRVIVGFAKLGSSDNAQMSITLQDAAGELDPIALSFGSIVTPEMAQAVLQNAENDRQPEVRQQNAAWMGLGGSEAEALPRDEFVLCKSVYGDFSDSPVTGVGQRARLYFNDARDLATVCLTTYASKLNDYYDGVLDPESCVYSFSLRLKATDGAHGPLSRYSHICNIYSEDQFPSSGGSVYLEAIFEDAMSVLGIPTSTMSAWLSGVQGEASKSLGLWEASIQVRFPLSQVINFDGTGNTGVPMVACLAVSEPEAYVGNSPYEFSTTLRYRTPCYVGTVNPTVTYTYTDVETAVGNTTITID